MALIDRSVRGVVRVVGDDVVVRRWAGAPHSLRQRCILLVVGWHCAPHRVILYSVSFMESFDVQFSGELCLHCLEGQEGHITTLRHIVGDSLSRRLGGSCHFPEM